MNPITPRFAGRSAAFAFLRVESRRHLPVFLTLAAIHAGCSLFFALSGNSDLGFASLLVGMAIGIVLPVYLAVDGYREFAVGERTLVHTLPSATFGLLAAKMSVFLLGSLVVWSGGLLDAFLNPAGLYQSRIASSSAPWSGIGYLLASKAAGTLCGLSLIGFALAAGKQFRRRSVMLLVIAAALLLPIGWLAVRIAGETAHWSLGSSSMQAYVQYAGPLTVSNVFDEAPADIGDTIRWGSVRRNLLAALLASTAAAGLLRSRKYEIYGK